jgi:hypothetical protein
MIMVLGPHKKKAEARAERAADREAAGRPDGPTVPTAPTEQPSQAVEA